MPSCPPSQDCALLPRLSGRPQVAPSAFDVARKLAQITSTFCAAALTLFTWAHQAKAAPAADYRRDVLPVLREYCYDCHGEGSKKGGVALDKFSSVEEFAREPKHWLAVWRNLDSQLMPPSDKPQLSVEHRALIQRWIEDAVFKVDPSNPDPGRVTVRRLNRDEYRNTIRDLLGVDFDAFDRFPPDDSGDGFENNGDVLSISPLLSEKYLDAAKEIVRKWSENPATRREIFPYGPPPNNPAELRSYTKALLEPLAYRVFRRPVDESSMNRLTDIAVRSGEFEAGMHTAMTAMLVSPRFLFRAEIQPEPDNAAKVVPVDEYALASRMSYFLWNSCPDWELLKLASKNQLRAKLREQGIRMLNDYKSERFVRNFVGQWLRTRDAVEIQVQPRVILGVKTNEMAEAIFNGRVREAMRTETEMLFTHLMKNNKPAEELFTADYTFLNQTLAKFYELDVKVGKSHEKVMLPAGKRPGGVLSHGAFLIVTSNPTRTSPVKRGLFVLENMLGTPTPPPPPNVPTLESAKGRSNKMTMRQQMELHRSDALCSSCHARMDSIGLALENYDALGRFHEDVNGAPLDTAGTLITGEKFANIPELASILGTSRKNDFYRCLSEKMLTYAIGRSVEYYDTHSIQMLVDAMRANGGVMQSLLFAILESAPFQKRRGDGEKVAMDSHPR